MTNEMLDKVISLADDIRVYCQKQGSDKARHNWADAERLALEMWLRNND